MLYFIINPNSGKREALRVWEDIKFILVRDSINYEFVMTDYEGHATSLAGLAIKNLHKNIICVGGDGTLNEIINGLVSDDITNLRDITVGKIPTGTGNDWCRMHNIPNDTIKAFEIIRSGKIVTQDIGKITFLHEPASTRYFVNVAGVGFDAIVARNVNIDKKNGKSGIILFAKNLLTSLFKSEYHDVFLTIDGEESKHKILSMAVGIGKYNGGGMMQLPTAIYDDGLLDVTVIGDISKIGVLRYAPLLFNGKFIRHPKVRTYRCKEIIIESEHRLPVESEGESAGTLPIKIEIIPKSLRIFSGV